MFSIKSIIFNWNTIKSFNLKRINSIVRNNLQTKLKIQYF